MLKPTTLPLSILFDQNHNPPLNSNAKIKKDITPLHGVHGYSPKPKSTLQLFVITTPKPKGIAHVNPKKKKRKDVSPDFAATNKIKSTQNVVFLLHKEILFGLLISTRIPKISLQITNVRLDTCQLRDKTITNMITSTSKQSCFTKIIEDGK